MKRLVHYSFFLFVLLPLAIVHARMPVPMPTGNSPQAPHLIPSPPEIKAKAYILMDAKSGKVLAHHNENERFPVASLTKIMALYVVSNAVEKNQIKMSDLATVSEKAWRMGGSRMFAKVGSQLPIKDLIRGVTIASGNDATVVLAEHVGGTEERFVDMMNEQARELNLKNTHFVDSTGLTDEGQYSSAYDLALITRSVVEEHPEHYKWYKEKWIDFNNIKQPNRNRLLWRDPSVDGLKTGFTTAAGYCLVASAERNGMRLISVVLGAPSERARINESAALINYGFRFFRTYKMYEPGEPVVKTRVWFGKNKEVPMGREDGVYITVPTYKDQKNLKLEVVLDHPIEAPVEKGKEYGKIIVLLAGEEVFTLPLQALENNPRAGIISRFFGHIGFWFFSKKGEEVIELEKKDPAQSASN